MFSEVIEREMQLNEAGERVTEIWKGLPGRFPVLTLDAFVVMPNHVHGIVITQPVGAGLVPALPTDDAAGATTRDAPTLGEIVGAFKSLTTHAYIQGVREKGWSPFDKRLWQRNYYEHIIRNEDSLNPIRNYIKTNPLRWHLDEENPNREKGRLQASPLQNDP